MPVSHVFNPPGRKGLLPFLALIGGLCITLVLSWATVAWKTSQERETFDIAANRTRELIQREIDGYLVLLDALRGLVAAQLSVSRDQFRAFVAELQLERRFAGAKGLGFAGVVGRERKDQTVEDIRKRTDQGFTIWPETDRDVSCPLIYLEPATHEAKRLIGYDLLDLPEFRSLLEGAAKSGQDGVFLGSLDAGEKSESTGKELVLLAPAYTKSSTPDQGRHVFGFLFCAFRLDAMLKAVAQVIPEPRPRFTLLASDGSRSGEREVTGGGSADVSEPKFRAITSVTVAGRPWKLAITGGTKRGALWEYGFHPWIMLGGVAVSFAVFGVSLAHRKARRTAKDHADARRDVEVRFRRLVEQSIVGIYLIQDERFNYVNPRMAEIFGCSVEDLQRRPLLDFIAEESRAITKENVQRRLNGEIDNVRYNLHGLRADGQVIHLEAHGGRIEHNGRNAILGCLVDVTERAKAEKGLRDQVARLDLLRRTTRAIAERQDLQSIFQVTLRSLEDDMPIDFGCFFQREAEEDAVKVAAISGNSLLAFEGLAAARVNFDEPGGEFGECIRGVQVVIEDISGSEHPFFRALAERGMRAVVLSPIAVKNVVFGVLLAARKNAGAFDKSDCDFLRHLSEHVSLAAQQAQLYAALEDAYVDLRANKEADMQQERLRAIGQMASGIAHDINNVIMPVCVFSELLLTEETALADKTREYLEIIHRASCDVAAIVARLREVYHPSQTATEFALVDLNEQVRHVLDVTRPRWKMTTASGSGSITVETYLAPGLRRVNARESEIRQALTNLVLNAIDAMADGGTLTISTAFRPSPAESNSPGKVVLTIADTGCGMDEDTKQRCLEPFFTTKGERGTGLGLPMVFGIMERHGGDVDIHSAPGEGTAFELSFPVAPDADGSGAAASNPEPRVQRVLAIDDDPVLLKSMRAVLESDGHFVAAYAGGQAGIDAFIAAKHQGTPFNVVITDLGMPQVDGRMVVSAIKKASPSTPTILLTGAGQRLLTFGEVPAGVAKVLTKPIKPRELRDSLRVCENGSDGSEAGAESPAAVKAH